MATRPDTPPSDAAARPIPPGHAWNRLPLLGGLIGGIGLLASVLLARRDPAQFYFSWLVAFLFFLSLALGALFFVLTHFATNASWSVTVRRLAENTMATLPWFLLLFLPLVLGLRELFHWSVPEAVAHDPVLLGKRAYLNTTFFMLRAAGCLLVWSAMAWGFLRASRRQDHTGERWITTRLIQASAPCLVLFAITVSLASIDWIMSLDPHWYSTMFAVYFFSGSVVAIFAFLVVLAAAMRRAGLLAEVVTVEHLHDLGKLLFAFTVFWAYIAFSQFFLIWYANIPEETVWYLHRAEGRWKAASVILALGHFVVPFLFLMSRNIKRRTGLLVTGAVWLLLMHLLDLHWLVMPTHRPHGFAPSLLDLTTLVAIGGLFLAAISWPMRRHALAPFRDPRFAESLSFENT